MRTGVTMTALAGLLAVTFGTSAPAAAAPDAVPGVTVVDHGAPIEAMTVVEGAYGEWPDGRLAAYAVPMGDDAQLNAVDAETGEQLGAWSMPGASGAPGALAVASDKSVYVPTFNQGKLFRFDPSTRQMVDLGRPVPGTAYVYGLSAGADGTIYGGTYPGAHVFSYHPDDGFTDLGQVSTDSKYVRSTSYDPATHSVLAGVLPESALVKIDIATGRQTRAVLPADATGGVEDVHVAAGKVFTKIKLKLHVFDVETMEEIEVTDLDTGKKELGYPTFYGRRTTDEHLGGVWFDAHGNLARYDLRTDSVTTKVNNGETVHRGTGGSLIGSHWKGSKLYGFIGNYTSKGMVYDDRSGELSPVEFDFEWVPTPLGQVMPLPGGKVAVNAFLNGTTVIMDPTDNSIEPAPRLGQVEDWWLSGSTLHAGIYTNGTLLSWDTSKPAEPEQNPKPYVSLKGTDQQIRPHVVAEHDGKIWAATEPDYGLRGGAVVILDPATGEHTATRDIVPDHTPAALEFLADGAVAVGTSTHGSTGTDPVAGSGHLVKWDPDTKQVRADIVPVEGAHSVNALTLAPDGKLWGLADGTFFELDIASWTVTRTLPLATGASGSGDGEVIIHPNGLVYVNVRGQIRAIDTEAWTSSEELYTGARRLKLDEAGNLWVIGVPEGHKDMSGVIELVIEQ